MGKQDFSFVRLQSGCFGANYCPHLQGKLVKQGSLLFIVDELAMQTISKQSYLLFYPRSLLGSHFNSEDKSNKFPRKCRKLLSDYKAAQPR
jgi:hypothetical protein